MKNNQGFSIIETLVALGLMSMGFLAFAQIMTNMNLSQNWSDFRLSTNALASSMLGSLNSPASCTQGFTGIVFVPTGNPVAVSFVLPNRTLSAGVVIPNYNLSINALNLVNYKPVVTNPDGSVTYFGDLSMTTKAGKRVLGPNTSTVVVDSIYLTTQGTTIIACGSVKPEASPSPTPIPTASPEPTPLPSPVPTYTYTPPTHTNDPCDNDRK